MPTAVTSSTSQNSPPATMPSTCAPWPVLSAMRWSTFSAASSRRVPARTAMAISQPTTRMPIAPAIFGR